MIQKIILFLCLLFLPTQLGLHFWPEFSYIIGFRFDYLSPTIYLTDIFLTFYILSNTKKIIIFLNKYKKTLIPLLIIISLNLLFSISPLNTLNWLGHLIIYILFVISLKINRISLAVILPPLIMSATVTVFLEMAQLYHQGSINGLFYWLGERSYSLSTPNTAKTEIFGRMFVRAYSTFSHPNSLAGYLLIIYMLIKKSKKYSQYLPIIIMGILLSLSKSSILCLFFLLLNMNLKITYLAAVFSTISPLLLNLLPLKLPYSIESRVNHLINSLSIIKKFPIFGVGYGNYLPGLAQTLLPNQVNLSFLQPVHNLVLLAFTEMGLLNLSVLIVVFFKKIQKSIYSIDHRYISVLILLSTLDHYLYTLPQNKLLLLISLLYLV